MATSKDAVTSDTEGQEKPVRKQLQKASISHATGEGLDPATHSEIMKEPEAQAAEEDMPDGVDKPKPAELKKKRSFEEIEGDASEDRPAAHTRSQHTRKRSRDSTAEEDELNNGRKISGERKRDEGDTEGTAKSNGAPQAAATDRPGTPEPKDGKRGEEKVEAMTSPKTKRSRLHSATAEGETDSASALDEQPRSDDAAKDAAQDTKCKSENTKPPLEAKSPRIPPASGFANSSTTSPFGSVASPPKSPPSDQPQTSASAFAASGFGSLAGAASSGFGALGKTTGGPAGGWASKKSAAGSEAQNGQDKAPSTFGGALGQQSAFGGASSGSAFGSSSGGTSAFGGKLGGGSAFGGSGFGSLGASAVAGGGLSSFASGKASPFASASAAKPSRPFGAPVNEDEDDEAGGGDDDEDGSGLKSPLSQTSEKDKQDERFFAQEHETGEEGEETAYSCRAKLYNFAVVDEGKGKKEWKERGLGTLRLNIAKGIGEDEEKGKTKARLVMRADGSHRLILNTPVQKDIKFGAAAGGPPQNGLILFMGAVDGKVALEMLQLKIKQQFALELYEKIQNLQEAM